MSMQLVYIAGPYRADTVYGIKQNIEKARSYAAMLWKIGYAVLCPHMNTALFDGLVSDETFLEGTLEMLRRCDAIFLMPGWERSEGARAELVEADRLGGQGDKPMIRELSPLELTEALKGKTIRRVNDDSDGDCFCIHMDFEDGSSLEISNIMRMLPLNWRING